MWASRHKEVSNHTLLDKDEATVAENYAPGSRSAGVDHVRVFVGARGHEDALY
jgi:hypothetical protein